MENEKTEFFVKWANYGKSHASWEPLDNLEINNVNAIARFEES